VIDHHTLQVETPEEVADLLRQALKHIEPERLAVCTDCGMGREGMSRRHAYYKTVALVRGTNIVRRESALLRRSVGGGPEVFAHPLSKKSAQRAQNPQRSFVSLCRFVAIALYSRKVGPLPIPVRGRHNPQCRRFSCSRAGRPRYTSRSRVGETADSLVVLQSVLNRKPCCAEQAEIVEEYGNVDVRAPFARA
jgi:hypothetical protein